jgi:hypothetical protein
MSTLTVLHLSDNTVTAANWQCPAAPVESLKVKVNPTYHYAAGAVMLGFLVGTAVAVITGGTFSRVASNDSASVSSSAAASNGPLVAQAVQTPKVQMQVASQITATPAPSQLPVAVKTSATPQQSAVILQHVSSKDVAKKTSSSMRKASIESSPGVSPNVVATAALAPESSAVSSDDAAKPFSFSIEGDFTIADFDTSNGMIETNEGKSFVIDMRVSDSNTTQLQDYSGNVHYRCDQTGSCTLHGAGVVVPNVKLTTT